MTTSDTYKVFLLATLLVADRKLEIRQHNIREVSEMLASGWITPEGALYWLWANGIDVDDIVDLSAYEMEDAA